MSVLSPLIDRRGLVSELQVPESVAEHIFQSLPVVQIPKSRRVFVKRDDVARLLRDNTFQKGQVRR